MEINKMIEPSKAGVASNSFEEPDPEPPSGRSLEFQIQRRESFSEERLLLPINQKTQLFIDTHYPGITLREWNSWYWQLKNSVRSLKDLQRFFTLSDEELHVHEGQASLPIRVTPYYLSLMDPDNASDPIRRSMIPVTSELMVMDCEQSDPLGEENQSPVPQLVHRYPDRALFLVTGFCAAYCRYCTRTHMVAEKAKTHITRNYWNEAIEYIRNTPQIRDVIISGGDPLTLSDAALDFLLNSLFTIPHVEMVRIGTKIPVVLPQRITPALVRILKKYQPLYMNIHFTHPDELTIETKTACSRLANAGIPLGSQTVLLKDINDNQETMKLLMHELLKARVRPYYIYQCDPIPGSSHFRTPVDKGLEIIKALRGFTSGLAVPHYVIDSPGGGGKIPILPEYFMGRDPLGNVLLKNYENKLFVYPDAGK
jgi:lysine 2,3-aminomutase